MSGDDQAVRAERNREVATSLGLVRELSQNAGQSIRPSPFLHLAIAPVTDPVSVSSSPSPAAICCTTAWIEPAYVSPLIGVTLVMADAALAAVLATFERGGEVVHLARQGLVVLHECERQGRLLLLQLAPVLGHGRGGVVRVELLGGRVEQVTGLLGDVFVHMATEGVQQRREPGDQPRVVAADQMVDLGAQIPSGRRHRPRFGCRRR